MSHGNLQAPAQFAGLYSRSLEDFETPWEVVELVWFDDPADHPTPAPNAWLLAMEDWSSLNAKDRVWHYKSRSDPIPFRMQCFTYYQTIETGLGDYLHYKPHPDYMNGSSHVDFP